MAEINKPPITYEDWLDLGRVIIPCLKGTPIVPNYTDPNFKITKEEWKTNYKHCEIALRLDQDIDLDVDNDLANYDYTNSGFITATLTTEEVQDIVGGMVTGNT